MEKRETKRINLILETKLLDEVDAYSRELCLNRTATITIILNQFLTGKRQLIELDGDGDRGSEDSRRRL